MCVAAFLELRFTRVLQTATLAVTAVLLAMLMYIRWL